jgi:hypothetical protein
MREMMFLIRTAFWLAVVIMLIPVDDQPASKAVESVQPIGAVEAASAAQATLKDVGGFCARNPTTCEIGGRLGTTFMLKARTGARFAYQFFDKKLSGPDAEADHGTLSANDLSTEWHGPKAAHHDI